MPCTPVFGPDGNITMIMCSRGPTRNKPCVICGNPSTKLCDYPVANDKTCDAPICDSCAESISTNVDYCPVHAARHKREKTGGVVRIESKQMATRKQVDFIKSLCQQTVYDADEYNFATMTKAEATEIISEMLKDV